ncbi:hypothetical protein CEXT_482171 [Caerostris extrusa]|uniref:Uncharacterized protein n=1 Tax=Caerostris extrusa TaxID=172846 RepID=A0AAV4W6U9_CAEEX|nr:hypothetical protein CEXT_482171 [Caerostris extrusa]
MLNILHISVCNIEFRFPTQQNLKRQFVLIAKSRTQSPIEDIPIHLKIKSNATKNKTSANKTVFNSNFTPPNISYANATKHSKISTPQRSAAVVCLDVCGISHVIKLLWIVI